MVFNRTNTLKNKDFKIKNNLEVAIMIKFSEFEEILKTIQKNESNRIYVEILIYKLGEIYQVLLRIHEYLKEKFPNDLKKIIERYKKSYLGEFAKDSRDDIFHNSKDITKNKKIISDFFEIKGEFFEGIRITKKGSLKIKSIN